MKDKMIRYCFDRPMKIDEETNNIKYNVAAKVVDMTNEAIVQACISAAKDAGIDELYLMDKDFIIEALKEKIEKTKREKRG